MGGIKPLPWPRVCSHGQLNKKHQRSAVPPVNVITGEVVGLRSATPVVHDVKMSGAPSVEEFKSWPEDWLTGRHNRVGLSHPPLDLFMRARVRWSRNLDEGWAAAWRHGLGTALRLLGARRSHEIRTV